jgi:predicted nucleic acid-binding protein
VSYRRARRARHPARERTRLDTLVESMNVAYSDEKSVEILADTFAALERRGARAPAMDLLIAVAALADRAPLVEKRCGVAWSCSTNRRR